MKNKKAPAEISSRGLNEDDLGTYYGQINLFVSALGNSAYCVYDAEDELAPLGFSGHPRFTRRDILNIFAGKCPNALLIEVKRLRTNTDPAIIIYEITLVKGDKSWSRTFGSPEHANDFLDGVEAGVGMADRIVTIPVLSSF